MVAVALMLIGAATAATGAGIAWGWPVGLFVAGLFLVAVGWDLSTPGDDS